MGALFRLMPDSFPRNYWNGDDPNPADGGEEAVNDKCSQMSKDTAEFFRAGDLRIQLLRTSISSIPRWRMATWLWPPGEFGA